MPAPTSDRAAIRQIIRALKAAGYTLRAVNDGEELIPVSTESGALAAIMAVDEATLIINLPDDAGRGWIYFVLGNEPFEVAADYTLNLSPVLDPLTEGWEE